MSAQVEQTEDATAHCTATKEGPIWEQCLLAINTTAPCRLVSVLYLKMVRADSRLGSCFSESHVWSAMTAAAQLFEDPQKEPLEADGLLPVLHWKHIDILHPCVLWEPHWCRLVKHTKMLFYFLFSLQLNSSTMFSLWLYNDIVINKIWYQVMLMSQSKCWDCA